jgi:homoserine kinase type II
MSVFTAVSAAEASAWLRGHDVGPLQSLQGILGGIDNSNLFLTTTGADGAPRRFVLTLFERIAPDELPYCLGLMQHLAQGGLAVPLPVADRQGRLFSPLNGKPAALVTRLDGVEVSSPDAHHARHVGAWLARMHRAGRGFALQRADPHGAPWRRATAARLRPLLDARQRTVLDGAMEESAALPTASLPSGPLHADLFRNNALFDGAQLSGVIDFYFSCDGPWLYDLAISAIDWCVQPDGRLDPLRLQALRQGYEAERPLQAGEAALWPALLRLAALRFWLSRLHDRCFPRAAALNESLDPDHCLHILSHLRGDGSG